MSEPTITFAAVPYVKTHEPVDLGPWRLWPNTAAAWQRETGVDLTWFMKIYLRHDGSAVDASASVLTRADHSAATREEFRDAIVAFSTLTWLAGEYRADPWVFELWTTPRNLKPTDHFVRRGKFSTNVTNASRERVRFGSYVLPLELQPRFPSMVVDFLRTELAQRDRMLRALRQLHEVRFETPYFSSLGNDLEAMWTGFETLFLPRPSGAQQPAMSLFRRLLHAIRPVHDLRRPARLYAAIEQDFAAASGIQQRSYLGASAFAHKLWEARNAHSHDGVTEPDVEIENSHLNLLSMGLALFKELLRIRIARSAGDNVALLPRAILSLNEIFGRQDTIAFVVKRLKKAKPSDLYPSRPEQGVTADLRTRLDDLVGFEGLYGWNDDRDVAKARGVLRRVLHMWIKEVPVNTLDSSGLTGIAEFCDRDVRRLEELKADGQTGTGLEDALDETLAEFVANAVNWRAAAPGALEGPLVAGALDLRLCLRSYVRLQELFLGYPLTG